MAASHLETAVARLLGAEGDPFAVSRLFYWLSESRWMHQSIVSRILRGIIEDTFPHLTGRMQTCLFEALSDKCLKFSINPADGAVHFKLRDEIRSPTDLASVLYPPLEQEAQHRYHVAHHTMPGKQQQQQQQQQSNHTGSGYGDSSYMFAGKESPPWVPSVLPKPFEPRVIGGSTTPVPQPPPYPRTPPPPPRATNAPPHQSSVHVVTPPEPNPPPHAPIFNRAGGTTWPPPSSSSSFYTPSAAATIPTGPPGFESTSTGTSPKAPPAFPTYASAVGSASTSTGTTTSSTLKSSVDSLSRVLAAIRKHGMDVLIPDSLHDYALVCVYVALKNFQDMAHRDLIDLIMAAQERHFSRELAGVTKTKLRGLLAILKHAEVAYTQSSNPSAPVLLYLDDSIKSFSDFKLKHDAFLKKFVAEMVPRVGQVSGIWWGDDERTRASRLETLNLFGEKVLPFFTSFYMHQKAAEKEFETQVEPVFRGLAFEEAFPALAPPPGTRAKAPSPETQQLASTTATTAVTLSPGSRFNLDATVKAALKDALLPPLRASPPKVTVIGGYQLIATPPGFEFSSLPGAIPVISDIGIEHLGGMGVAAVPLSTLETVAEEEDDDSRHFGQLSSEERLLFSWDTGDTSAEDATLTSMFFRSQAIQRGSPVLTHPSPSTGSMVSSLASTSDAEGEKRPNASKQEVTTLSALPETGASKDKDKDIAMLMKEKRPPNSPGPSYREALLSVAELNPASQQQQRRRSRTSLSSGEEGGLESDRDDDVEDILQRILLNSRDRKGSRSGVRGTALTI